MAIKAHCTRAVRAQFIAALGDPAAAFRFVRIGHPGYNAEIGRQFPLTGKIVDIADGG